jgi:hypothetical protein
MKLLDVISTDAVGHNPTTVAVFPGRFQPFHRGHAMVFEYLQHQYGDHAYIATSNAVGPNSPFSFDEKKELAAAAGVDANRIVYTRRPYQPRELLQYYQAGQDRVVMALSYKDHDRFKFTAGSYFQPWHEDTAMLPFNQHAYIMAVPTVDFMVGGQALRSATAIRNFYAIATDSQRWHIIKDLYGHRDPKIKHLFDRKLAI